MACVRCGKTGFEQSSRLIGRMRLVHHVNRWLPNSVDALTVDVSCVNREYEVIRGFNSKNATPVRHASLREAVATYRVGKKLYKDIAIGMRASVNEVRRLLARGYPDAAVKLIKVSFNGTAADLNSDDDPIYLIGTAKGANDLVYVKQADPAQQAVLDELDDDPQPARKPKPLPVASDREAVDVEPVESALDPESIAGQFDLSDANGVRDLAQWFLEGVSPGPWRYVEPVVGRKRKGERAPREDRPTAEAAARTAFFARNANNAAAPLVTVADAIAPTTAHEPAAGDSEWAGVIVRDGRGVEYDIAKSAAQFEVAPEKIALWFGHPKAIEAAANASMIFAGKTLAEWSDIKGESVAVMAARMVETGTPFEGKRAAIQPPPVRAHVEALPEVAEPVSEPQDKPAEAIAPTVEPEAVSAPVRDPMAEAVSKLEAIEDVRPLTRKERREYARLEAKIAKKQLRAAQQTAKHMPATKAKATAIASRALAIFDSMGVQAGK
jgi:hypothetical protein